MAGPAFSILLPTHNRPETLGPAIRSVLAQGREDWELLVVGDGCTDGTGALVAGFGDARIRWFDLPKAPGFGYANRNLALCEARGELVAFLGHDNLLFADHLARLAAPFARPGVMFAHSRPLFIGDDGLIVPFYANLQHPGARDEFMQRRNLLPATTIMHRRACFDTVGMWPEDETASGDWVLWKRMLAAFPAGVAAVREPTCLHFRADWRDPARWAPAPFRFLQSLHERGGRWYPQSLDLQLAPGELPQAQVWRRMQAEGPAFVNRVRWGVDLLGDWLAWTAGLNPAFP